MVGDPAGSGMFRNNGFDGDNWSANNIETGGAGAIGVRVPFSETLAAQIRSLKNDSAETKHTEKIPKSRHRTRQNPRKLCPECLKKGKKILS